ncbi:MAG: hypothetical protein KAI17_03175 [Thiotrichaceae bacterium]|nr:hypothetical protein [Thiotrichaceae bacterium]
MSITFELNHNGRYFISTWAGVISNGEMLAAYKDFFEGDEWHPGLNELADTSQASLFNITSVGLCQLAIYTQQVYGMSEHASVKTSAYCPKETSVYCPLVLPFKLAVVFESWANESVESIKIFRDFHEAESWLTRENQNQQVGLYCSLR